MSSITFLFISMIFIYLSHSINAFNITQILNQHPDFSTFNDQLTQTGLATTINSRRTITVLAVDNGAISGVSGLPAEQVKKVLSLHVVLDYFDMQKLTQMRNNSRILTTLFQSSGEANGQQGFLNATKTNNGVVIGSAVEGSSLNSNLMKSVAAQPYNVSVLQVSNVIVPPNLGNSSSKSNSTASPPKNAPKHAPTPIEGSPTSESPSSFSSPPKIEDAPVTSPESNTPVATDAPAAASGAVANICNYIGHCIGTIVFSLIMGWIS